MALFGIDEKKARAIAGALADDAAETAYERAMDSLQEKVDAGIQRYFAQAAGDEQTRVEDLIKAEVEKYFDYSAVVEGITEKIKTAAAARVEELVAEKVREMQPVYVPPGEKADTSNYVLVKSFSLTDKMIRDAYSCDFYGEKIAYAITTQESMRKNLQQDLQRKLTDKALEMGSALDCDLLVTDSIYAEKTDPSDYAVGARCTCNFSLYQRKETLDNTIDNTVPAKVALKV